MKINFFLIIYTIFSISFLISLSLIKGTENLFSGFFAYVFILFIQYKVLVSKDMSFLKFITAHNFLNYVILILGFLYYFVITILLVKNIIKIPFGYFVLTGCASSCFYTFFICKEYIDK